MDLGFSFDSNLHEVPNSYQDYEKRIALLVSQEEDDVSVEAEIKRLCELGVSYRVIRKLEL